MQSWKREPKKVLANTPILDLVSYHSVSPDQKVQNDFFVVEMRDWANVVAITKDKKILFVKQYRHGINDICLELPGGIVEKTGEDRFWQTAQAELLEETGYTTKNWQRLGRVSGNPGFINNWCEFFVAEDVEKTHEQSLDPQERIEVVEYPIYEIPELIEKQVIHHSIMVAALGLFFMRVTL